MTTTGITSHEELAIIPHGVPSQEWQASKRQLVRELFSAIAPGYDRFNRVASLGLDQGWRRRTIREAALTPGMRVLDVCTGTGDLALLASRQTGDQGLVVGLDFTWPMLQGAARRQAQTQASVDWLQADALVLPFRDQTFDRIVMGFSTRNLADLSAGIRELLRVLKPDGQVLILETGWPSNPVLRVGYWAFLATVVRLAGWIITGKLWPFTYFARSVKGFLTPAAFADVVRDSGGRVQHHPLSGGLASLYVISKGHACAR